MLGEYAKIFKVKKFNLDNSINALKQSKNFKGIYKDTDIYFYI